MIMDRARYALGVLFVCMLASSCATTQSRYVMLGQTYPPRSIDCDVEVFKTSVPSKGFIKIARIDAHLEKSHFIKSDFEDALPELKKQACLSGADAIIEIQERSSSVLETKIYHVTATGIKYKDESGK